MRRDLSPVRPRPGAGLACLAFGALVLTGCNSAVGTDLTRAAARSVVNPVVAQRFPGLPLEPATDCIINNASGDELITLATAAATRDDPTAARSVTDIARRPDTIRCFGQDALPTILNTL